MSDSAGRDKLDPQGLPEGYHFRPEWEVTPRQVRDKLADDADQLVLIDCRTHEEHEIARIEGATLMPMNELHDHLDDLAEMDHREMVVYCHHGIRSLQVTLALKQAGIDNVKSMAGGIDLWSLDIDPAVTRY